MPSLLVFDMLIFSRFAFIVTACTQFTIPEEGISAGQAFGLGPGSPFEESWELVGDAETQPFSLNTDGDNVFVYCLDADNVPNFLWGYSYSGPWADSGLPDADYGEALSALPESIENLGNLALEHNDNCVYNGKLAGRKTELQKEFMDPTLFTCLNELRIEPANGRSSESGANSLYMAMTGAMALVGIVAALVL